LLASIHSFERAAKAPKYAQTHKFKPQIRVGLQVPKSSACASTRKLTTTWAGATTIGIDAAREFPSSDRRRALADIPPPTSLVASHRRSEPACGQNAGKMRATLGQHARAPPTHAIVTTPHLAFVSGLVDWPRNYAQTHSWQAIPDRCRKTIADLRRSTRTPSAGAQVSSTLRGNTDGWPS
jgi:hypothetical protein